MDKEEARRCFNIKSAQMRRRRAMEIGERGTNTTDFFESLSAAKNFSGELTQIIFIS